jgi:hypothetical protein
LYAVRKAIAYINQCKIEKIRTPKKVQIGKIENVAGSVWLSLFMDGTEAIHSTL